MKLLIQTKLKIVPAKHSTRLTGLLLGRFCLYKHSLSWKFLRILGFYLFVIAAVSSILDVTESNSDIAAVAAVHVKCFVKGT